MDKNKDKHAGKQDKTKKNPPQQDDQPYRENGDNFSAGHADAKPMPNDPARNAERTSPEEDQKKRAKD